MKNYYEILELTPQASLDDIKKAYRKLARRYHPDLNPDDKQAEEMFKRVSYAYQILSDENSKRDYDNHLNNRQSTQASEPGPAKRKYAETSADFSAMDFESMQRTFENFFGFSPKDPQNTFVRKKSTASKKNPLDASDAFEKFFKMRKK